MTKKIKDYYIEYIWNACKSTRNKKQDEGYIETIHRWEKSNGHQVSEQTASLAMRNFFKIEILLYNHQTGKNYKVENIQSCKNLCKQKPLSTAARSIH